MNIRRPSDRQKTRAGVGKQSNPVSLVLRPVAMHAKLRLAVGIYLAVMTVAAMVAGPGQSAANDTSETTAITILPEPETILTTQQRVRSPLPHQEVSQGYWAWHRAVDFRTPVGTPINPIMRGIVVETGYDTFGYGNKIVIDHQNGYKSLYAHLEMVEVGVGAEVSTDRIIGKSGNTGRSTGPHLHLELWENGKQVNPTGLIYHRGVI